jgi:hypothetical protein
MVRKRRRVGGGRENAAWRGWPLALRVATLEKAVARLACEALLASRSIAGGHLDLPRMLRLLTAFRSLVADACCGSMTRQSTHAPAAQTAKDDSAMPDPAEAVAARKARLAVTHEVRPTRTLPPHARRMSRGSGRRSGLPPIGAGGGARRWVEKWGGVGSTYSSRHRRMTRNRAISPLERAAAPPPHGPLPILALRLPAKRHPFSLPPAPESALRLGARHAPRGGACFQSRIPHPEPPARAPAVRTPPGCAARVGRYSRAWGGTLARGGAAAACRVSRVAVCCGLEKPLARGGRLPLPPRAAPTDQVPLPCGADAGAPPAAVRE